VLRWRISNSMEAAFCVDCLEDALREHGKPEVFNADQGSQFTSDESRAFSSARRHCALQVRGQFGQQSRWLRCHLRN
jgi:transposase InsO family protein